ncbi:MAG: helix-turn-helix domain-containing protein [Hymenobacter sp.]
MLGICTRTMERVRRQFCEEGLAMFEPKLRKTRSDKKIDGRVEAHLTALLCQSPPDEQPRWQLQLLADRLVELAGGGPHLDHDGGAAAKKRTQAFSRPAAVGDSGRAERGLRVPDGAGARPLRAALRRGLPGRVPGRVAQATARLRTVYHFLPASAAAIRSTCAGAWWSCSWPPSRCAAGAA